MISLAYFTKQENMLKSSGPTGTTVAENHLDLNAA